MGLFTFLSVQLHLTIYQVDLNLIETLIRYSLKYAEISIPSKEIQETLAKHGGVPEERNTPYNNYFLTETKLNLENKISGRQIQKEKITILKIGTDGSAWLLLRIPIKVKNKNQYLNPNKISGIHKIQFIDKETKECLAGGFTFGENSKFSVPIMVDNNSSPFFYLLVKFLPGTWYNLIPLNNAAFGINSTKAPEERFVMEGVTPV